MSTICLNADLMGGASITVTTMRMQESYVTVRLKSTCLHVSILTTMHTFPGTTESPVSLEKIRLANVSGLFSGRVEVFYNGSWGTVCDDGWTLQDANIVCKQLHFGSAKQAVGRAYFGAGSGPILLDEVQCSPGASTLSNCQHNPIGMTDCTHAEDAGVICKGPGMLYSTACSYHHVIKAGISHYYVTYTF